MDLQDIARARGLSQRSLSEDLGVSEATMSKWLRRDIIIPTLYLRRLSDRLGVRVDDLLPPNDAPTPNAA